MAYNRLPQTVLAGTALKQNPPPTIIQPAGIVPVTLDADIATATSLGVVKVGIGIAVAPDGTISSAGDSGVTGHWIPKLSASDNTIIPVTVSNARYSKIGQLVFCTFDIAVTSLGATAASAKLSIDGLPAVSAADPGYVGSGYVSYFVNMNTDIDYLGATVAGTSINAALWYTCEPKKSVSHLTRADVKVGTRLVGTIHYISAA